MISYQCVPVCVVFARFQCVCIYSRRWFVPTLHSQNHGCATLAMFRNHSHLFLFTLYMPVFVSNLFVCVNCILSSCIFLPTRVFLPSCLSFYPFRSDLLVSTLLVCLYCLCPLSVFVSTLVGVCAHSASARSVYSWCFSILCHTKTCEPCVISEQWVHILIHASCKIFN